MYIYNFYTENELSIFGPRTMDCSKAEISLICELMRSCLTYISTPGVPHTTHHSTLEYYNHISYSFSFYMISSELSQVLILPSSGEATVGNTVVFSCLSYGAPSPTITWSKDGDLVQTSPGIKISQTPFVDGGFVFDKSTVEICSIEMFDAGEYRCLATNSIGSDSGFWTFDGT